MAPKYIRDGRRKSVHVQTAIREFITKGTRSAEARRHSHSVYERREQRRLDLLMSRIDDGTLKFDELVTFINMMAEGSSRECLTLAKANSLRIMMADGVIHYKAGQTQEEFATDFKKYMDARQKL